MEVQPLAERWLVALGQNNLDHQQRSVCCDRLSALRENGHTALVIPVVQHIGEQIGVSTSGYGRKEVSSDYGAAVVYASRRQIIRRGRDHMRAIKQRAPSGGIPTQDR